ncbi:hypothetical protein F5879DRAFT_920270 [Lentinula edodes]|nr:hypothetical protein F5879DRAFT_920270 [Lentinula edodes]
MKAVQEFTALVQFEDSNSTTLVILPTFLPKVLPKSQDIVAELLLETPPCHHSADRTPAPIPAYDGKDSEIGAIAASVQRRYAENVNSYGVSIANLLDSVIPMPAPPDTRLEATEVQTEPAHSKRITDDALNSQQTNIIIPRNQQHRADHTSVHQRTCMANPLETNDRNTVNEHQVKRGPQSISSGIRYNRRQVQRRSPYPTRRKHVSNASESRTPTIMGGASHGRSSASTASQFGYATPEYRQQKVRLRNVNTFWYTYRTLGPLDHPPNLPPNHAELQLNDIFLHIDEYQMGKLPRWPRIPKLLPCVKMWIWNSAFWERISFGEERIIGDGDILCISLFDGHKIVCPTWITPKSMKRVLKDLHRVI